MACLDRLADQAHGADVEYKHEQTIVFSGLSCPSGLAQRNFAFSRLRGSARKTWLQVCADWLCLVCEMM